MPYQASGRIRAIGLQKSAPPFGPLLLIFQNGRG
jgi:hypothetical protein